MTHAEVGDKRLSQSCIKLVFVPTITKEELSGTNETFVGDSLDFVDIVYWVGGSDGAEIEKILIKPSWHPVTICSDS